MNTDITTPSRKPGRPPVKIEWPDGEFSVEQLHVSTKLSKVTLYQKVNDALLSNTIEKSGSKEKVKQGCPRTLFRKVVATPVATPVAA